MAVSEPAFISATEVVPDSGETHIRLSIQAPPGTRLRVVVETVIGPGDALPAGQQPVVLAGISRPTWPTPVPAVAAAPRALPRPARGNPRLARLQHDLAAALAGLRARDGLLPLTLFVLATVVYDVTRFVGLAQFPIYFFTDEAIQTVQAARFIANGLRDSAGHFFPTYFENGAYYNLSVSVYAQVLPYLAFGKSIAVTRGVSAMISLFGAVVVSLTLKNIFHAKWWWLGTLLLAVTPAWFLHSRTAFEVVIMVALYAGFLYFYLLYRVLPAALPAAVAAVWGAGVLQLQRRAVDRGGHRAAAAPYRLALPLGQAAHGVPGAGHAGRGGAALPALRAAAARRGEAAPAAAGFLPGAGRPDAAARSWPSLGASMCSG